MLIKCPAGLDEAIKSFLQQADWQQLDRYRSKSYDFAEVAKIKPHPLNPTQITTLRDFITRYHPQPLLSYLGLFTVERNIGNLDLGQLWLRRSLIHFLFRWVDRKDRHIHAIEIYLRETKAVDSEILDSEMARCVFVNPNPPEIKQTTLEMAQGEQADLLFFKMIKENLDEPVLGGIIDTIIAEQQLDCAFFEQLLKPEIFDHLA